MEAKFAAALIRTLCRYADGVCLVAVMFASGTRRICNDLIKRRPHLTLGKREAFLLRNYYLLSFLPCLRRTSEGTSLAKTPSAKESRGNHPVEEGLNWGTSIILNTCNMKQFNFRHFNTNSKEFSEQYFFSRENCEAKTAPKRPILFCLVYQEVFGQFSTIPDYFRRFPRATEDVRRFPKTDEDVRLLPKMSKEPFKK